MSPWLVVLGVVAGALVVLEWAACRVLGRRTYTPSTTLASLASGVGAAALGAVVSNVALYQLVAAHVPWQLPANSVWTWLLATVALDFIAYWAHRAYHAVPLLWAMHAVHHQSHEFNMATGIRAPWLQPLMYAPFAAALALTGVPGEVMGPVYLLQQVYKLLAHSTYPGHLGPLEYLLCTPRRHAVHHRHEPTAVHGNFGGLLLVWDQLFGTLHEPEGEPQYGLGTPLPADPVHNNLEPWRGLWREVGRKGLRALLFP
jgi:alkylglycerol monooxygenase